MSDEVLIRKAGSVGRITLNRPEALNALTLGMCRQMIEALLAWQDDPDVTLVLIDAAGERAFCAGGDIRALADSVAGDGQLARDFFRVEYQLDEVLFRYVKPTACILDGVVMGGGAGIARPCRYRIASERITFAMPETGIGLFPDVGWGWRLPRMPGKIGLWLALTGARIKAADALLLGVATDFVERERLPDLTAAILEAPDHIERLLTEVDGEAGRPEVAAHEDTINRLFDQPSVEAIEAALEADGSDWALTQLAVMRTKSPLMQKTAFHQLRLGLRHDSFAEHIAMEYRIAMRAVFAPDFREGVRAAILDKDGVPRWSPRKLEDVSPERLDAVFAPLPSKQEWRPLP